MLHITHQEPLSGQGTAQVRPYTRDPRSGAYLHHPCYEGWLPKPHLFDGRMRKGAITWRFKGIIFLVAFKGATCWEAQFLDLWVKIPLKRFRAVGCKTTWGVDPDWLRDQE